MSRVLGVAQKPVIEPKAQGEILFVQGELGTPTSHSRKMACGILDPKISFFPKADGTILRSKHVAPPLSRPQTVGPIFDRDNIDRPIEPWSSEVKSTFYPNTEANEASMIPVKPPEFAERYLRAFLAEHERLRLSVLWYYTRDVLLEDEFLAGLQEKAQLAQESTGWEFAVIGILDVDVYIRLATVGLELGILPRGETLCAHTVTQPPGVSIGSSCAGMYLLC